MPKSTEDTVADLDRYPKRQTRLDPAHALLSVGIEMSAVRIRAEQILRLL